MGAGILQFTLGLTTGNFLGNMHAAESATQKLVRSGGGIPGVGKAVEALGKAGTGLGSLVKSAGGLPVIGTAIVGLTAAFTSFHAVVEGTFSAIEKGAGLGHLAARTGESVQSLFQ